MAYDDATRGCDVLFATERDRVSDIRATRTGSDVAESTAVETVTTRRRSPSVSERRRREWPVLGAISGQRSTSGQSICRRQATRRVKSLVYKPEERTGADSAVQRCNCGPEKYYRWVRCIEQNQLRATVIISTRFVNTP